MTSDITAVRAAVEAVFREEWGRVVATLIRMTGDWDLAEECAQDAFALALSAGRATALPGQPGRLADHRGAQPRHRRPAPEGGRRRQTAGGGRLS